MAYWKLIAYTLASDSFDYKQITVAISTMVSVRFLVSLTVRRKIRHKLNTDWQHMLWCTANIDSQEKIKTHFKSLLVWKRENKMKKWPFKWHWHFLITKWRIFYCFLLFAFSFIKMNLFTVFHTWYAGAKNNIFKGYTLIAFWSKLQISGKTICNCIAVHDTLYLAKIKLLKLRHTVYYHVSFKKLI
jgi:hypothetical protein